MQLARGAVPDQPEPGHYCKHGYRYRLHHIRRKWRKTHWGTGIGGGTLLGLSNKMLNIRHFDDLIELAQNGNLANVDLNIGDITRDRLETFPEITASTLENKRSGFKS